MVDDVKTARYNFSYCVWSKTYAYYLGCGVSVAKQQGAQRRIVGGDEAGFGSFPWQVIISIATTKVQYNGSPRERNNVKANSI